MGNKSQKENFCARVNKSKLATFSNDKVSKRPNLQKNYRQHTLQAIWALALMENGFVFGMIWQIRRMGLI
ncbi:hypothetical protein EM308_15175 [Flavobacterium gilvum]|uniref:Uncharacterized protein n=1 Tax=Flavobacterium gilvum TaxID=1492737 RepID=A0AAC9I968_9FLAO|nr:hypothetical protein EM308_15175 [Flavobacterium gilvum]KFC60279.1 hypothetical protein FEM08_08860 [Flavobacterium gilvum]